MRPLIFVLEHAFCQHSAAPKWAILSLLLHWELNDVSFPPSWGKSTAFMLGRTPPWAIVTLNPTLFGETEPLPSDLRQLVTLTPAQGGLDVPDIRFEVPRQFAASTSITASHVDLITTQSMFMVAGENSTEELKSTSVKSRIERIDTNLPSDLLRSVNQSRDKGASSWLTAMPLVDQGLALNKQEFQDALGLKYNMPLSSLPSKCVLRGIPSAMPCHAKREGSWRRETMVFATYLPHLLVRFAPTLKSNHDNNLSITSDSTSEARWQARRQDWTWGQGVFGLEELQDFSMSK